MIDFEMEEFSIIHFLLLVCVVIYTLLSIMGYAAYGDNTPENILWMLLKNKDYYVLTICINATHTLQLLTTCVIVLIPSLHAFEVRVNCPDGKF